jgi:hypothetical protein
MSDITALVVLNPEQPVKAVLLPYPPGGIPLPSDLAYTDHPNVFTDVNTLPGLRVGTGIITADYNLRVNDFEILVDANAGPVNITLPLALGTGQIYRVKKIDSSTNPVGVVAQPGDLIDGQGSVVIQTQYDDCTVLDADLSVWDRFSAGGGVIPSDIARKSQYNIFQNLNSFKGLQFTPRLVTADYVLTLLDFEVIVDATGGPVAVALPVSAGNGQYYRVKKIDDSDNVVTVNAVDPDLIDGSISVNLSEQWADCSLIDAAPGYWDNIGGGPAEVPPTTFYIGDNARFVAVTGGVSLECSSDGITWVEQFRYTE